MLILEQFVEAVRARLAAAGICGGAVTKNLGTPSEDARLPSADVFVASDGGRRDGDARAGLPTFVHTTKLVVEITDHANSGPELKAKLCAAAEAALDALLCDLSWGGTVLEGIDGIEQTYNQPPEGRAFLGAVQLQIDLLWRSGWQPRTTTLPDFAGMSARVPAPDGSPLPGIDITVPTTA